jgi:hypothetical protein
MMLSDLPVFDDVLHLDSPFEDNYFWWIAGSTGAIALIRDWLSAFPHAVLHFDSLAAVAWGAVHLQVLYIATCCANELFDQIHLRSSQTLSLLDIDPHRVVFGPALARRVHLMDEPERWHIHPAQVGRTP